MSRLVLVGLALVACTRDRPPERETPPAPPERPAAAPREPRWKYACARAKVPPVANALLIHDHIRLSARADMPLRWITWDDEVYELGPDPLHPTKLGAAEQLAHAVWDDRYRYRPKCYEDCIELDSMGVPHAVERIDRLTGERKRLTEGHYGLGDIALHGDHVYWGIFGHQADGGVWRVPKLGGEEKLLRLDPDRRWEDRIQALHSSRDGILVEGTRSVGWISASGEPRLLFEVTGANGIGSAVLDDGFIYIAEEGDPHGRAAPNGAIHRIALGDGARKKLTGLLKDPEAIATFGADLYFLLGEGTDIWVVSKTGGEPRRFVTMPDSRSSCDTLTGLWADGRGLFWLVGWSRDQALYFMPWPSRGAQK